MYAPARMAVSRTPRPSPHPHLEVKVRRIHRRDLNRTWEFLKRVFRDVNRETAENTKDSLRWYRTRNFFKLDAAIFLAQKVATPPELLPPRRLKKT